MSLEWMKDGTTLFHKITNMAQKSRTFLSKISPQVWTEIESGVITFIAGFLLAFVDLLQQPGVHLTVPAIVGLVSAAARSSLKAVWITLLKPWLAARFSKA